MLAHYQPAWSIRRLCPTTASQRQKVAKLWATQPRPNHAAKIDLNLLAIDVEYVHIRVSTGKTHAFPAQVSLVSTECTEVYTTYFQPSISTLTPAHKEYVVVGGVPEQHWRHALPLAHVLDQLESIVADQLLVGHGLHKDLKALGLQHPRSLLYDTMEYAGFQGNGGAARSLGQLARQHLGRELHVRGRRHDAAEDAKAVMELYMQVVLPQLPRSYDELVQVYRHQYMQQMESARAESARD